MKKQKEPKRNGKTNVKSASRPAQRNSTSLRAGQTEHEIKRNSKTSSNGDRAR